MISPRGHKDTVRALVRNHAKGPESQSKSEVGIGSTMDIVRGKGQLKILNGYSSTNVGTSGKGLIILLHGEPGRCCLPPSLIFKIAD